MGIMEAAGSLATYEAEQKKEEEINETLATKKVERQNGFLQRFAKRDDLTLRAVDSTWWAKAQDQAGVVFMALPYMPFFSNCRGYDNHVYISKLLENHPNCTRRPDIEVIVEDFWNSDVDIILPPSADECSLDRIEHYKLQEMWGQMADNFPLDDVITEDHPKIKSMEWAESKIHPYESVSNRAGIGGHGQKMGIKLSCIYEENIYVPAAEVCWFEAPSEAVLFHISKFPVENANFIAVEGAEDDEEDTGQPWGQTEWLQANLANDQILTVAIDGDTPGLITLIPRTVQILIPYYQVTRKEKSLVRVEFKLFHFCTVTDAKAELILLKQREPAVYSCIAKADEAGRDGIKAYDYTLEVHFFPSTWFDLLNAFQFGGIIYALTFFLVGILTVVAGFIFWGMHRLLTRMKHPPPFRWRQLLMLVAPPPLQGVLLATAPVCAGYFILYVWIVLSQSEQPLEKPNAYNFEGHAGDWQDQAILDTERVEKYRAGRLGASFLFMGMYLTMMGCKMFVPQSADDHADDDTMAEVGGGDENFDDDEDEMLPPSEFWTPLLWKRTHMLLFCYGC